MNLKNAIYFSWGPHDKALLYVSTTCNMPYEDHAFAFPKDKKVLKTGDLILFRGKIGYSFDIINTGDFTIQASNVSNHKIEEKPVMFMFAYNSRLSDKKHVVFFDGRRYGYDYTPWSAKL